MNQIQNQNEIAHQQQQPGELALTIRVSSETATISFATTIDRLSPFNIFKDFVKDQIFAQQQERNFSKTIIYLLGNATINEDETKTLAELGFLSGSEFTVRLHLKGGL